MSSQQGPKAARPALRTYFVGDYFTGTPVNIRELSGECWGGGGVGPLPRCALMSSPSAMHPSARSAKRPC